MNLLTIFKILIVFVSTAGYWKLIKNKTKLDLCFIPLITISFQVFILFFAGIMNILLGTTIVLYFFGIICFIYFIIKEKKEFFKDFKLFEYIFLFLSVILIGIAVFNKVLTMYDNFSHWGLVVKNMLLTNRFPNSSDNFMWFQQYPLGSASFIYYFSKMISNDEWIQMLAQGYMEIAFLLPLTKYIKKNKIFAAVFLLLFFNFLLVYNIKLTNLAVDTLLPIVALGMFVFIYEEIYKIGKEKNSILFLIPITITLCLIKNSAIFFILLEIIFILVSMKKNKKYKSIKYYITLIFPMLTYFLWNQHCQLVFKNAAMSKHAMTIQNYIKNFNGKTQKDILNIIKGVLEFFVTGQRIYVLIAFIIFVTFMIFLVNRKKLKKHFKIILILTLIFFLYLIGTIGMYIFSMPLSEAKNLATIGRYINTILIFIYGVLSIECIKIIAEYEKNKILNILVSILIISSIIVINITSFNKFSIIYEEQNNIKTRQKLETIIKENNLDNSKKYVICIPKYDKDYTCFLAKYLLLTKNITTIVVKNTSQLDKYKKDYYIINLDENNKNIIY